MIYVVLSILCAGVLDSQRVTLETQCSQVQQRYDLLAKDYEKVGARTHTPLGYLWDHAWTLTNGLSTCLCV